MVSTIITTKNRIELLKIAISSVLNQTYKNIECIVVDDGSTDGTEEYCRSLPIVYIRIPQSESKGGNYARNIGIQYAQGEYIAFLDDDDYWYPTKIEQQYNLSVKTNAEFVYCYRYMKRGDNLSLEDTQFCLRGNLSLEIFKHYISSTSCFFIHKKALNTVGLFDEKLTMWQDYDLFIRLAQVTNIQCVNKPLVVYLINENDKNRISNNFNKCPIAIKYIKNKYQKILRKAGRYYQYSFKLLIAKEIYYRAKKADKWAYIISMPFVILAIKNILFFLKKTNHDS